MVLLLSQLGYSFLEFQRRIIKSFLIFFLLSMGFYVFVFVIVYQAGGSIAIEVMNRIITREANYMWIKEVYPCISLLLITLILLVTITFLRRDLQSLFYEEYLKSANTVSLTQLKMHTVEVKSKGQNFDLLSKDLKNFLQAELAKLGYHRKILGCIIVPDYSRLIELERDRSEVLVNFDQIEGYQPVFRFLIPQELKTQPGFEKKLRQIEVDQDAAICTPLLGSFTAFVILDNLTAVSKLAKKFA